MNPSLPNAKSAHSPDERAKIKRVILDRNLSGLANDTKWDEFIAAMRVRDGWKPSYRCKCVDGPPSFWDVEWFYHFPFPMISVEWLDIAFVVEERSNILVTPEMRDESRWIESLLKEVGLDYQKGEKTIRIFGYCPRSMEFFDV